MQVARGHVVHHGGLDHPTPDGGLCVELLQCGDKAVTCCIDPSFPLQANNKFDALTIKYREEIMNCILWHIYVSQHKTFVIFLILILLLICKYLEVKTIIFPLFLHELSKET